MNVTDKEEIKIDPCDMIVNREVEVLEVRAEIAAMEHKAKAGEHEKAVT